MIKSINAYESRSIRMSKNSFDKNQEDKNYDNLQQLSMPDSNNLKAYHLSFKGITKSKEEKSFATLKEIFTPKTKKLWKDSQDVAKRYKHKELNSYHLYLAILETIDKYITDLDSGERKYDTKYGNPLTTPLEVTVSSKLFKDEKNLSKIAPVIKQEIQKTDSMLKEMDVPKSFVPYEPKPSKRLMEDIDYLFSLANDNEDTGILSEDFLLGAIISSQDEKISKMGRTFVTRLQQAVMIDKTPLKEKFHLKFFDDRADNIWKNIDLGNDMFVIYDQDNEDSLKYLLSSFANLIQKPDNEYKKLNKDNTEVIFLNQQATFDYMTKVVDEARKNPDKTTVIIANFFNIMVNSSTQNGFSTVTIIDDDLALLKNQPSESKPDNVRILMVANKDTYYANINVPGIKRSTSEYALHSLPVLNVDETKKVLLESPEFVKKQVKRTFKPNAIVHCIEVSNSQEGNFPEKTLKLMRNIATYYVDKEEITLADVKKYLKDTKGLTKANETSTSYKIVFDTGKKLKDIVGNEMTKAEAASIVRQIKDKSIGTKGFIIYSNQGSAGGGRKHTAEAISGEAKIPFISINARDFALKDIDALSQNADLSELKIKKLVSLAKTQAEANPNRAAMIFIENFDNFGANPLTGISSIYEQKAFSQLLTEMENIRKNENVNLVIVGSANYPEYIDEAIIKPYKFLDQIIVYSPQDKKDRIEILNYYIKKNKLKIAGETEEEKNAIINNIAETTAYFSVVNLMDLLDKAKNVAKERNHKAIEKGDFTEAYLQATSGRPSTVFESEHRKAIVASHECGHALNLQVMYEIAKKQNIPWHLPNKVDFITLDPRGSYGGAMYPKESENEEFNFEQVFANLVCDFGGHSSEKKFYQIDGSWGITADMEMATEMAKTAVQSMGLGPKTGKISISETPLGTIDVSPRVRNNIDKDIELLLKNANIVSDKIVCGYNTFIQEFTEKYKSKVGTGDCIIPSDVFQNEINEWKSRQSKEKINELELLESKVIDIMGRTKKGELVNTDD